MCVNKKVLEIITEWDPVQLFPLAPKDEYAHEVNSICKIITANIDVNYLSEQIFLIFTKEFDGIFKNSIKDCYIIAQKIISAINND